MKVINSEKLPIKIWITIEGWMNGNYDTEPGFIDAIQQAKNLANHPLARKHVALMPDFHVGYGMPIGGVLATQGGVVPNAVGVDIGCGMIAMRTNMDAEKLSKEDLQNIRLQIHKLIPVGMNHHKEKQNHELLSTDNLILSGMNNNPVIREQWEKADYQIGTLGGGNHFIEIQKDQHGKVWVMIHSGSRNLGKQVCDYYHKKAKELNELWHSDIPDPDLAFLPEGTKEYDEYMKAMNFCLAFAEASRLQMLNSVKDAFEAWGFEFEAEEIFDTHHNFAAKEHHFNQNFLIHRKGAVKAEGKLTIPGSMGTASYICEGLQPTESFNTCSHGAGRAMGRKHANSVITHDQAKEMMKDVVFGIKQGDYDEMPIAYKDIHDVIKWQSDLVKPLYTLTPLAVCKG